MIRRALILVLLSTAPSWAAQTITLVNKTGTRIDSVYLSIAGAHRWTPDLIQDAPVEDGETTSITLERADSVCRWDLLAKFNNGSEGQWRDIDLCAAAQITLLRDRALTE